MFPSGYSSSHSYQFLHILSILLIVCVVFFIISALPASIQKYLTVVSFLYWLMMSSIFFMFTRHLYIFLGAICIEIFCFNWITLSYYWDLRVLYIFCVQILYQICDLKIFLLFIACLFISLMSFEVKMFLKLIQCNWTICCFWAWFWYCL